MGLNTDFWFKFKPSKFLAETAYLTLQEKGAYITLLCHQFQSGAIPDKTICFLLGNDSLSIFESLKPMFKQDSAGRWFNQELQEMIADRSQVIETKREAGKKGGRPKKQKESTTKADGLAYDISYDKANRNHLNSSSNSNSSFNSREEGVTGEEGIDRSSNLPATIPADITPLSPAIIAGFVQNRVETQDGTLIAPNPRSCPMPDSWGENPAPEMWADELHRIWKGCRVEESGVVGRFTYIQIASIGMPTRDIWENALWYLAGKVVTKSKIFAFKTYWDGKHYLEDWMAKYEQLPEVKKIIDKATKKDRDNDAAWEAVLKRQQQNAI